MTSLLLHVGIATVMRATAPQPNAPVEEPLVVDFDTDVAPAVPEPEALEAAAPAPVAAPEPAPAAPTPAEPTAGIAVPTDAGVREVADAWQRTDAGVPAIEEPVIAEEQPQPDEGALADQALDIVVDGDLGAVAVGALPNAPPIAPPAASGGEVAASASPGGDPFPGTGANLLSYMPAGDVVTVLIRFDRIRDTKWAALANDVLAPLPDYRNLVGGRKVDLASLFDTLVVSTPDPRVIAETTLAAHARSGRDDELRALLNHPAAPVAWSVAKGGALGRRGRSALIGAGDERVFLMPQPGWMVMAAPRHLGSLLEPASGELSGAKATVALPRWLAGLPALESESGEVDGPALMVTIGHLADEYRVPGFGSIPGPERITGTLELTAGGFLVRGNAAFATEEQAKALTESLERLRTSFAESRLGKYLLERASAHAAVTGLRLRRSGSRVAFATSVSEKDGRAMLELAAAQSARYFRGR